MSAELLNNPCYKSALRFANIARSAGDEDTAFDITAMARGGELQIALFAAMDFLVQHDIPVSYDDYQVLESEFSHEDDDPDLYPKHYYRVADDEVEVFKKLKLADE